MEGDIDSRPAYDWQGYRFARDRVSFPVDGAVLDVRR